MSDNNGLSTMEQNLHRAESQLARLREIKKQQKKIRQDKFINQTFYALLLVIILLVGGYFGYSNQTEIVGFIQQKASGVAGVVSNAIPEPSAPIVTCDGMIVIKPSTKPGEEDKITVSPVFVGKCYNISEGYRDEWKKIVERDYQAFAQHISNTSDDKSLPVDVISERLTQSTTTWILDLRSSQVQDPPKPTVADPATTQVVEVQAPTEVPVEPTPKVTPTPVATSIPQVVAVPWPEKERGFSLEELALVMTEHNITTVSGENKSTTPQDRIKWALYYQVSEGVEDYVVYNAISSPLPESCSTGTSLTISLAQIDNSGAMKMTVGTGTKYDIYFVCK
ncbi:MAG: hypothetical protein UW23_C0001G0023 [Candidatus Collierbacteria bacterium GW2011_GWA1_44_12]|uniref:Uncharacterized protein n=1 Tax=Candidatus Collierbacteria bacterium GW2011_GWA1_44_12 TaxID=1618376 RepID=A0A0G1GPZ4_9BACT|nr:MAG: hypothetical protein UW23_C0001G0023 [Candidatus Collierbacteria bacterium GW2011_GWA1_44_12]